MTTLERQTEDLFARERLLALLSSYFGGFAVLLACIGLYGLMSYGVTQRTAEMGLRMALGAQPSAVRWLVVRESAWTVIAGAASGCPVCSAVVRLVQSQLFGVQPDDPPRSPARPRSCSCWHSSPPICPPAALHASIR